jgi:hypothetical protein
MIPRKLQIAEARVMGRRTAAASSVMAICFQDH